MSDQCEHLWRFRPASMFEQGDKDGLVWECAYCRAKPPLEPENDESHRVGGFRNG